MGALCQALSICSTSYIFDNVFKQSVKLISFNTVHKKDTIIIFLPRTHTDNYGRYFLLGFVCSCLFCLWQKGNPFIALGNKLMKFFPHDVFRDGEKAFINEKRKEKE